MIIDKGIYRPSSAGSSLSVNQLAIGTPVAGSTVRMLYGLTDGSFLSSINESTIESVSLNVFTWVGEYPPGIYICPYLEAWTDGGIEYCSSEASFDNYGSSESDPFYQEAFAQEYCTYGIDNILSYWLDIESTGYGFIIISDGEGDCYCYGSYGLALASVENVSYLTSISINEYSNVALTDFSISGSTTMSPNATQMCGIVPTPSNATSVNNVDFTWSSSNSSVVSVSSSGLLSAGENTGTCTITAQHIPTGISRNITVTVEPAPVIADGVYRIYNSGSLKYLTVYDYGYTNNTNVRVKSFNSESDFSQLWRIADIGNGYFSIRPLNKPNMGLDITGTNAAIYSIGISDSSAIINSAKWMITERSEASGEYYLQNYNDANKILTASYDNNAYVDSYYGNAGQRWIFEPVTVNDKITVYGDSYLTVGETTNLSAGVFSSETLNQSVRWSCTSYDVSVSSNGTVTALTTGFARVRADSTVDSTCYGLFDIYIGPYEDKSVGLVGIPCAGHDHSTCLNTVCGNSYLGGIFGASNIVKITDSMTVSGFCTLVTATPITMIRTHGRQKEVYLSGSSIYAQSLFYQTVKGMFGRPFDECELMLLCCCLAGEGGRSAENMVNACFDAGAKYVIGFEGQIICSIANDWFVQFCHSLYTNYSEGVAFNYSEAALYADRYTVDAALGGLTARHIRNIDED